MAKNILFLHHNFPGQFKNLATHLDAKNHNIKFLTETNFVGQIGNIDCLNVEIINGSKNASLMGQVECGKRYLKALIDLKKSSWVPDIIISHSGWGCGIFAKDVFPNSYIVSYSEWWFSREAPEYRYNPNCEWFKFTEKSLSSARLRNLSLSFELTEADAVVCPTYWQKSQLPTILQQKTVVIHEGVDVDYFKYNPAWRNNKTKRITYATRGLEPMRGFPQFIQALKPIFEEYENIEVVIAAQDKVVYGGSIPKEGSYWKWAQTILSKEIKLKKVKYLGHLDILDYARLLKSSHLHIYLTRPFVVSWSLIEAMASGCCIMSNKIEAVQEIVSNDNTLWCDLSNIKTITAAIRRGLELTDSQRDSISAKQRSHAVANWNSSDSLSRWMHLLKIG